MFARVYGCREGLHGIVLLPSQSKTYPSVEPDIIAHLRRLLGTFKDATWDFYLKSESLQFITRPEFLSNKAEVSVTWLKGDYIPA